MVCPSNPLLALRSSWLQNQDAPRVRTRRRCVLAPARHPIPCPYKQPVYHAIVKGRRERAGLRRRQLSPACHHHLGHFIHEHLGELLYLFVAHTLKIRSHERQEVIESLPAREICLGAAKGFHCMEYRNFRFLCRSCHTCFCAAAIRHKTIVEEIPKVPVLAESARSQVFKVMDMDITIKM